MFKIYTCPVHYVRTMVPLEHLSEIKSRIVVWFFHRKDLVTKTLSPWTPQIVNLNSLVFFFTKTEEITLKME